MSRSLGCLADGGELLITVDNPTNPLVALRNMLPFVWLNRLGLVPYYVGATYSLPQLSKRLSTLGMEIVQTAVMLHFPRVVAVPLTRIAEKLGGRVTAFVVDIVFLVRVV